MVLASSTPIKTDAIDIPTIDLSLDRTQVSKDIIEACEKFGFFKVINHGVPHHIIQQMEEEGLNFFSKPLNEKQQLSTPLGYGCKNIGYNGDLGDVEYILLNSNNQNQRFHSINHFRSVASGYTEAVRELACKMLDLMAEGLWVHDTSQFSRLITDVESDWAFRINHYPPVVSRSNVGFGEHSDPQIITLLRSNDVGGLEISLPHHNPPVWVPVSPDPTAFFVNVGDLLQAMTNGRFVSVRHRAMTNTSKSRISMGYFAAPPLHALVSAPQELLTPNKPSLYRPFTWADYKKVAFSLRLGDSRLQLFRNPVVHDQAH